MRGLSVLYDAHCGLCREARTWLEGQVQWVPLEFVAAASAEARQRFPELNHAATLARLTLVGSGGEVYRGSKAWLMCMWALRDYRELALTWSSPLLRPAFDLGVWLLSGLRGREACEGSCAR